MLMPCRYPPQTPEAEAYQQLERVHQRAKAHSWNSQVFYRFGDKWIIRGADAVEVAFCCPRVHAYQRPQNRYQNPVVAVPGGDIISVVSDLMAKGAPVFLVDTESGELQEFFPAKRNSDGLSDCPNDVLRLGFSGEQVPTSAPLVPTSGEKAGFSPLMSFREAMAAAVASTKAGAGQGGADRFYGESHADEWIISQPDEVEVPF